MLRTFLFWFHFGLGAFAGLVIGLLCVTGVLLTCEQELVEWSEREARWVEKPAGAQALSAELLFASFEKAVPGHSPSSLVLEKNEGRAWSFQVGREEAYYINPYTGEVRRPLSTKVHAVLAFLERVHRWLAFTGEGRDWGRAVTGACNAAFVGLALSGLWLWWPRGSRLGAWKRGLVLQPGLRGRARDWNWHRVLGFWSLPLILTLSVTGLVLSYPWANRVLYAVFGEVPPQRPTGQAGPRSAQAGLVVADLSAALTLADQVEPGWSSLALRSGRGKERLLSVKNPSRYPVFASTQVRFNTGEALVQSSETYASASPARKVRLWFRFLHTGQALGWPGQALAALGCLAGLWLVWTGYTLAWARLTRRSS